MIQTNLFSIFGERLSRSYSLSFLFQTNSLSYFCDMSNTLCSFRLNSALKLPRNHFDLVFTSFQLVYPWLVLNVI